MGKNDEDGHNSLAYIDGADKYPRFPPQDSKCIRATRVAATMFSYVDPLNNRATIMLVGMEPMRYDASITIISDVNLSYPSLR